MVERCTQIGSEVDCSRTAAMTKGLVRTSMFVEALNYRLDRKIERNAVQGLG